MQTIPVPVRTYTLRFPFRPLHWVTGLETASEFTLGDYSYRIAAYEPYLILTVQPFLSEGEALAYLPTLWGALAINAVSLRTGFLVEMNPDKISFVADPVQAGKNWGIEPFDGLVSGQLPSILPNDRKVRFISSGHATITQTFPAEKYLSSLLSALNNPSKSVIYDDVRLRSAVELLSDYQKEVSPRSKFLTCMIALEVLAGRVRKHVIVQQLLDDLNEEIQEQESNYPEDSEEHFALVSLQRELVFRREASLRSSIRKLVFEGLADLPENERLTRSKEVVWSYDIRSTLVHDGTVPQDDLTRAHHIAYNALIDLLARRLDRP